MNPGNIDAQPTASVDHHAWGEYVRAKLPIVDLNGGDVGGDNEVSIAHDGIRTSVSCWLSQRAQEKIDKYRTGYAAQDICVRLSSLR